MNTILRKVTITLEDTSPEEGTVAITVAFDPSLNLDDAATPATVLAMRVFEAIKKPGKGADGYTVSTPEDWEEI